jgi:hypothetical protein
MVHFKDLLKDLIYPSGFEVVIDGKGTVISFKSDSGIETIEDIQKFINVMVKHGYITIREEGQVITISIDDIGMDDYPYYIDVYHNLPDGIQDEDSVVPYTQELIDEIMGS